jgi:hypothetical protein
MGLGNVTQLRISPHLKIVCCESFGKVEHFKGVSGGTFFWHFDHAAYRGVLLGVLRLKR